MIINNDAKWIFIATPKTGSKSISNYLGQTVHPKPSEYHMGCRRILQEYPETFAYFQFAFVRNPWARLVSLYYDFTIKRVNQYSQEVSLPARLLSEFGDFKGLCLGLKKSHWARNLFFIPQTKLVTYRDGCPIDYIGRFENFIDDFRKICTKLQIPWNPENIEHANKGVYDKSYRDYYDAETIEAVAKFYADDIRFFNYEF